MSDYDCPKCGSSNTKSLSAIWMSGNRTSNTKAGGFSVSSKGSVRFSQGRANTLHTSEKVMNSAPPAATKAVSPIFMAILSFFASFIILAIFVSPYLGLLGTLISWVGPFFAAFYTYRYFKDGYLKHQNAYQQSIDDYNKTWLCQRCNHQYTVED